MTDPQGGVPTGTAPTAPAPGGTDATVTLPTAAGPAHRAARPIPGVTPAPAPAEPEPAPEPAAEGAPAAPEPAAAPEPLPSSDASEATPVVGSSAAVEPPAESDAPAAPDSTQLMPVVAEESAPAGPAAGPEPEPAGPPAWSPSDATVAVPVRAASPTSDAAGDATPPPAALPPVIPPGTPAPPAPDGAAWGTEPGNGPATLFPESQYTEPPSRAGAHWWGVAIALVLSPVAWFLLTDGSARLFWSMLADPADVNLAGYLSFGAGLLALGGVLLAARWSSVGPIIAGSISAAIGLTFLVIPVKTLDWLAGYQEQVEQLGGFGRNLYAYTVESGMRGSFVVGGVVLIGAGMISHGARRKGRREEKARLAVRAAHGENPFA